MKNTTSAAITGALVTAAIGGLAYVGKRIYDKHHYHGTVFGDDPADWESDPYVDDDEDDEDVDEEEEFYKKVMPEYYEDEKDEDELDEKTKMVHDPFDHLSPDDPIVKEAEEYVEEEEETAEENQ